MDIGKRIKARRKELGLNAETLAKKIGVSPATIYRYESADILNMGIDKVELIANALYTTPAYLMGWSDEVTEKTTDLTQKDQIEIDEYLDNFENELMSQAGLMFDGEPMSQESREKLIAAMRIGAEMAKKEAKEKYTPKKYRNQQ